MTDSIDEHFVKRVGGWAKDAAEVDQRRDPMAVTVGAETLLAYFDAQIQSRHLDFAARWLQAQGEGFYTIGSAGHESNAAVAMALRLTDPALLHYRSGGFYAARAQQLPGSTPIADVVQSLAASTEDPISGGRHKVFGNAELSIIPQTSTIASHLPRAVGLAFSLGRAVSIGVSTPWPEDSVVVASFGDASANHSTALGALNAAAYCTSQGVPLPALFVCEDNGIGISTKSPNGWVAAMLSRFPGVDYIDADGTRPASAILAARQAAQGVRERRAPAILHLRTVRYMGHAGSDAELAYRSRTEILRDYELDPLIATAANLVGIGALTPGDVLDRYELMRETVMAEARKVCGTARLDSAEAVMAPLTYHYPEDVQRTAAAVAPHRAEVFAGKLPEDEAPMNLSATINATLVDIMAARSHALLFGEDIAVKGGVYGVTRGLRKKFGAARVFDTLLDEQTILGTALGAALAGFMPIPEIQYLAYLHNAEDQLRGEAASLTYFSDGQYANGMVVRVAGLAYQKGFGGHFHNDNSIAVLRDIPGIVVAVPSRAAEAPDLLRTCVALAAEEGRVCVFLEPIALYHQRDLFDGDGEWLASYRPPGESSEVFGRTTAHGSGEDVLLVTFGNGVRMSLRAAERLRERGVGCTVLDLRWLAPLPEADLTSYASRFSRILVVDETRRSGGVGEAVLALLADGGHDGVARRVSSRDTFVPLGPAADLVLLSEDDIVQGALDFI